MTLGPAQNNKPPVPPRSCSLLGGSCSVQANPTDAGSSQEGFPGAQARNTLNMPQTARFSSPEPSSISEIPPAGKAPSCKKKERFCSFVLKNTAPTVKAVVRLLDFVSNSSASGKQSQRCKEGCNPLASAQQNPPPVPPRDPVLSGKQSSPALLPRVLMFQTPPSVRVDQNSKTSPISLLTSNASALPGPSSQSGAVSKPFSKSRRLPGQTYTFNGRKVLSIQPDGLCFFRALMVHHSDNQAYASAQTCSSKRLKKDFMRLFGEAFERSLEAAMDSLINIFLEKGRNLESLCYELNQLLIKIPDNLSSLYSEDQLLKLLNNKPMNINDADLLENLAIFSDTVFSTMIERLAPNVKFHKVGLHYDLFVD